MTNNFVYLVGNATGAPEVKRLDNGKVVCNFGLAVDKKWNKGSEERTKTNFFRIECWGKMAEMCEVQVLTGRLVSVQGELEYSSWVDKATNENRTKIQVQAEHVYFFERPVDKPKEASNDIPF